MNVGHVGAVVLHSAVEPQRRRQVAGLSFIEDPEGVNDVAARGREWHLGELKLGDEDLQVERPDVITAKVAAVQIS